jgi:hypothetical protein
MDIGEGINIGDFKSAIASEMPKHGFTGVIHTAGEVAGNRNDVRFSVLHLFIGDRSFYQVAMASGDTFDNARRAVDDMLKVIGDLHFL